MADFNVLAATVQPFAVNAGQALTARGRSSGAAEIPADFAAERTSGGVPLSVNQARAAVDRALIAGAGVLDALRTLAGAFRLATASGLVDANTNLTDGGTRVSGVTITAQGGRLLAAVDDLVASAAISGANLIGSGGRRVTIQTTEFGGRVTVTPQPLDSVGLGLDGLSAISREDAVTSLNRIEAAITLAETRIDNLGALRDGLAPGGRVSNDIARLLSSGGQGFLPRGSLVNQIA